MGTFDAERFSSPRSMATSATTPTPHSDSLISPRSSVGGTPRSVTGKRARKQCSASGCSKVDAGGGYCVAHGGGKKCAYPGCQKGYQTGGFCRTHGGGARCTVEGCGKVDAGRGLCRAHGGGKRCQVDGCTKADVGGGFCTAHGGGKRCSEPGCTKIDQGGGKCRAHGGARRCREAGCKQTARGSNGLCSDHGGARLCSTPNCRRLAKAEGGTLCVGCAKELSVKQEEDTGDSLSTESVYFDTTYEQAVASCDPHKVDPFNAFVEAAASVEMSEQASAIDSAPFTESADENASSTGSEGQGPSNLASCLDNGCAKSFGGRCNCTSGCSCCSRARLAEHSPAESSSASASASGHSPEDGELPVVSYIALQHHQLRLKLGSLPPEVARAFIRALDGVRSVHVKSHDADTSECVVTMRCNPTFSVEAMQLLARINVEYSVESSSTSDWAMKEIALKVADMMCPGNCGRTVMNALLQVKTVNTANLVFEERCVVARGVMSEAQLCEAVVATGFEPVVLAVTPLPQRFRFRVNDFASVHLVGRRLTKLLENIEGVENILLIVEKAEILVEATVGNAESLLQTANSNGIVMVEMLEDVTSTHILPFDPTTIERPRTTMDVISSEEGPREHVCDVKVCPHNGCEQYMVTVAHTAALAVGWSVPGCAMAWGGECTCGEKCKCKGCPEHNPLP